MRRRLPQGVRMYHRRRLQLCRADRRRRAGLFRRAARHFRRDRAGGRLPRSARLTRGDTTTFHDILAPTVPLSRHIFKAPTRFYKTGVVFMAYLNGLQDHFTMVGGQESARSTLHLAELFRLADAAGLLADPDRAAGAHAPRDGGARRAGVMRDLSNDRSLLVDQLDDGEGVVAGATGRRLRPRRHLRDLAMARHRAGLRRRAPARLIRDARADRHLPLPRRHVSRRRRRRPARGARRQPPRGRRGRRHRRAVPRARWPAGCRRARATSPTRARQVRDALAALLPHARRPACRSRSSRCIRCTPPTAPA